MKRCLSSSLSVCLVSSLFVSCLEEDEGARIENLSDKLDGQRFDIGRTKEFIALEEMKIKKYNQAKADMKEVERLTAAITQNEEDFAKAKLSFQELNESLSTTEQELKQARMNYRAQVRKEAIGQNIDLSETMGEKFKEVRVMAISPLAIKVYMPSGPTTVPLKDLSENVREMLQMGEDEVTEHLKKQDERATARAEKIKKWNEGKADRAKEASKQEILQRMKDLQEEIYEREDAINVRLQEMKAWKSKASNMDLDASREKNEAKSQKIERLAELARDKARDLSDKNSDSWVVVGRLKAELEDLKRRGIR